jgi:amino acid adenylation domain-containing protein
MSETPLLTQTPLSFAQEQLWFIDEFHHGLPAHNVPVLLRLHGRLDVAALRGALGGLAARHQVLRTRLAAGAGGMPEQLIDPSGAAQIPVTDYTGLDAPTAEQRLRELASAEALRPFQLARDQPLRAHLVQLAAEAHALVLVSHRTAFDDPSLRVLIRDLSALYGAAAAGGRDKLPAVPLQFADYAIRERSLLQGTVLTGHEDYWRGALAGLETSRFPADRPRPLLASHDGAVHSILIGRELLDGLRELSSRQDVPLSVVLLTTLYVLMYRYTGQTDLVVGAHSQDRDQPELAPLIGPLAGPLPIRADLSGDPPFTELLGRVRDRVAGARAHAELPFAKVVEALAVERDPGRFPVFQVAFACQEPPGEVESAGVLFRPEPVELPASMYDVSFVARPRPDGLRVEATYTPALFDAVTVERLLDHLEVALTGVVTDPGARLSALPLLTPAERHRELAEWNDTEADLPYRCIHHGFEAQVAATPGAIAAEYEDQRLTYAQLNHWADRVAARLTAAGAGPETLTGVCMGTGLARLAALLGTWKAGAGYVPLDPALPSGRLAFMITDTAMTTIVTDQASAPALPPGLSATVITLEDHDHDTAPGPGASRHDTGVTPANVAYVIYTSGSTGPPKGVVVEHRQACNFLDGMIGAWHITPDSAVLGFAAFTFDVSVMDMFMPLLAGARIVLAAPATLHSPPRLAALIRDRRITFACLPPAVLALLTGEQFPHLRTLLSAGEELTSDLLRAWLRPGLEIYNGYGPTEASIGSTFMKLEASTPLPPPIGRPKPNYRAYVLDGYLNPVPVGVTGELHIGGAGVARGYLRRPDLTRERFIADPFTPGQRLYKTGDLVRRRPDGTIVFLGRADHQVKIRGLRIELGEIEATLTAHPAVAQAVVTLTSTSGGDQQLTAYVRPEPGKPHPTPADLRAHLARTLPAYMLPAHHIIMDTFPLTTNGKIDRSALPAPETAEPAAGLVPPRTLLETLLVDLYATVLGHDRVDAASSFFDVGGSSLLAMRMISQLRADLAVDLDVSAVFATPAPRQLAALLRDAHGVDDADLDEESIEELEETTDAGAAPQIEVVARDELVRVLDDDVKAADLDLDLDMADRYGLTSLNKVIFLMSVCDETSVSLSAFTEPDVAAMRTLRDVVAAVSGFAVSGFAASGLAKTGGPQ